MAKKLIGVDLGGTTIKFAILTENGSPQRDNKSGQAALHRGKHQPAQRCVRRN